MMVQWLILHASNAGSMGLNPGQGTKILHATWQWPFKEGKKKIYNTGKTFPPTFGIYCVMILNSRAYSDLLHGSQLGSFSCIK